MIEISFESTADPWAVVATEIVTAPLEHVWRAHTDADLLRQWWAPHGYVNHSVALEARAGSGWSMVQADPEGHEFAFSGIVTDVVPRALFTRTLVTDVFPEVPTVLSVAFSADERGTRTVTRQTFPDEKSQTGYLHLGGTTRMAEASQHLAAVLASLS